MRTRRPSHNFSLVGEPSEPMAWSHYSENEHGRINVDMLRAVRRVEQIFGEQLVHVEPAAGAERGAEVLPEADGRDVTSLLERLEALERDIERLTRECAPPGTYRLEEQP